MSFQLKNKVVDEIAIYFMNTIEVDDLYNHKLFVDELKINTSIPATKLITMYTYRNLLQQSYYFPEIVVVL